MAVNLDENLRLMRVANGKLNRSFTTLNGMVFGAKNREFLDTLRHMKKLVIALDATSIELRDLRARVAREEQQKTDA